MNPPIRLRYIFIGGVLKQHSVQNKISCQVKELRAHGIDAHGWFFNTLPEGENSGAFNEHITKLPLPLYTKQHRFFQDYHAEQSYYSYVADYIRAHQDEFDLLFIRQVGNGPGFEQVLTACPAKTILYIPSNRIRETYCERRYTDDNSLVSSLFSWYAYIRFWFNEKRIQRSLLSRLRGVVTFTPEFGRIIASSSNKAI
ncbi:MAG: hypothetical protein HKN79_02130, partial [Flavobacteriales bacterium]|nr:hypothetical protein [Flavobacteriales bacterium]